jgi:uncharacterized membrane protein YccC
MRSDNKLLAFPLLLLVCAGAGLQLQHWNQSEWSGGRGAGKMLITIALILLAIVAPRTARAFYPQHRNKRINGVIGLVVVAAIAFLAWSLYSHYYGPLVRSIDDPNNLF